MDIKKIIKNAIQAGLNKMEIKDTGDIELEIPPDDKMGDVAFPCFKFTKILKNAPNKVAEELAEQMRRSPLRETPAGQSNEDTAGQDENALSAVVENVKTEDGYINFFYKKNIYLSEVLKDVLEKGEEYGKLSGADSAHGLKIMVEYSGPNTNKPLHLGHGRNSFLGMAVSNLLKNAGAEVIRANMINNRGLHICKSMLAYKLFGDGDTPEKSGLKGDHFVGKYYAMFNDKLKENPDLEIKTKELLEKWEAGNTTTLNLWETMNDWYYKGVNKTYKTIGSEFDENYYESETYKHGKEIVREALKKKIVYPKEDGAIAIDLKGEGLDEKILLRSNGTSVYITQDLYTAKIRFEKFNLNKLIYVVGNEQNYHFNVLFKILRKLGYDFAKDGSRLCHLSYGMVNIPGGKLKSREGTKVDLDDIVEKLKNMALKAILEKTPPLVRGEAIEDRAMKIGLAALKFMLLKVSPNKNVFFNPEEAISFEGDTGPYIMYAYARIKSILRKAGEDGFIVPTEEGRETEMQPAQTLQNSATAQPKFLLRKNLSWDYGTSAIKVSDEEMKLAKLISAFPDILFRSALGLTKSTEGKKLTSKEFDDHLVDMANSINPAILANYLLDLAGSFNHLYHIHPVIDAETENLKNMRLALVSSVAIVLKRGLEILGIDVVERM